MQLINTFGWIFKMIHPQNSTWNPKSEGLEDVFPFCFPGLTRFAPWQAHYESQGFVKIAEPNIMGPRQRNPQALKKVTQDFNDFLKLQPFKHLFDQNRNIKNTPPAFV